ncbi:MAG: glycoside hydrolase family 3 C-terminal domain-containing protein [Clostridium sp.]|jgi:beta-glucosidase|nr:glycoside hydrolase family 3 C-terminal domain-containing protein [Clostridium sp.]
MGAFSLDLEKYQALARQAAAESVVLLRNRNKTLPLAPGEKVAVFGRSAFHYYKSGLGSGGLVNTRYVTGILDALKGYGAVTLNRTLLDVYEKWIGEHPADEGAGWGRVPCFQEEMPLEEGLVARAARESESALVVIGRTAGEDQDTYGGWGGYLLTDTEQDMIRKVVKAFPRCAVVLNVGNIIDMKWVRELDPAAVLYVWQGGQEGGNGVLDVLTGAVPPSGRLTDTLAENLEDYPSARNFGSPARNVYEEDIYVGYRYFETFAPEKVLYPFGFGLSYTTFAVRAKRHSLAGGRLSVAAEVENTGSCPGKEVVMLFLEAPQGKLGKPARVLLDYAKTPTLAPGERAEVTLLVREADFASYDASGVAGHKSCFVIEEGDYHFYLGRDVRGAEKFLTLPYDGLTVVRQLEEACAPVTPFRCFRPVKVPDAPPYQLGWEPAALRSAAAARRGKRISGPDFPYTGDRGIRLADVYDGKAALEDFIAQLSDEDLIALSRGEGMSSPKVTPGTGAAFGGITKRLNGFGIPAACCTDGPSGLRMDCGAKAFSLPSGTALGCTFHDELVRDLFAMLGLEMRKNKVDVLLGPGMNIHRNPLNGRNFEYISEDPVVTGKCAAAQLSGMQEAGVTGTMKHFCCNHQEAARSLADSVVSERALREIYFKGYEIAIRESRASAVMTTYGSVNGLWTAGNYELCTTVLRGQLGFDGIVMTDWWAKANVEGREPDAENKASMVGAQNDLFMCVSDGENPEKDNLREALEAGEITRGELHRNARNILSFLLKRPVMLRELGRISEEELRDPRDGETGDAGIPEKLTYYSAQDGELVIDSRDWDTSAGHSELFGVFLESGASYRIELTVKSDLGNLAQLPISVFFDNIWKGTLTVSGTDGQWVTKGLAVDSVFGRSHYIKLFFAIAGARMKEVRIFRSDAED